MAIATHADVAAELQRTLTAAEQTLATSKIAVYQAELEDHLHRSVEQRSFTETLNSRGGFVFVNRGPIVSITEVKLSGVVQPSTAWEVVGRERLDLAAYEGQPVEVTYVGGWPTSRTAAAKDAVVSRVARFLKAASVAGSAGGGPLEEETVEGEGIRHTVKFDTGGSTAGEGVSERGFTEADLGRCSSLKLRVVV